MKFFAAIKQAEFAANLFAAAGMDLEKLLASGDVNALKAHLEALKPSADAAKVEESLAVVSQEKGILSAENATLNAALASAKQENDEISAKIKDLEAKASDLETKSALKARELLAKAGMSAPIATGASSDVSKPGNDKVRQVLSYADFSALSPVDKMSFSKSGGRIQE